jgi:hypothetical protein
MDGGLESRRFFLTRIRECETNATECILFHHRSRNTRKEKTMNDGNFPGCYVVTMRVHPEDHPYETAEKFSTIDEAQISLDGTMQSIIRSTRGWLVERRESPPFVLDEVQYIVTGNGVYDNEVWHYFLTKTPTAMMRDQRAYRLPIR